MLGTAVVDANGNFSAPLTPAQANGQIVTLSQADAAGNISPVVQVAAPDITAPTGLTAAINGAGSLVTGTGEIGATVTVRDAAYDPGHGGRRLERLLCRDPDTRPAQCADLAGHAGRCGGQCLDARHRHAPDLTAPLAPVGTVSGDGTSLTGTARRAPPSPSGVRAVRCSALPSST